MLYLEQYAARLSQLEKELIGADRELTVGKPWKTEAYSTKKIRMKRGRWLCHVAIPGENIGLRNGTAPIHSSFTRYSWTALRRPAIGLCPKSCTDGGGPAGHKPS